MTKNAFILNFFKLYNMLWRLSLPFLKKNRRMRSGFQKRINASIHTKADVWIQAASAGEAYLAAKLLKTLCPKKKLKILITTTTFQGMDILQTQLTQKTLHTSIDLKIEWFPFDMPDMIERTIQIINPGVMVLLETEIWPALLYFLKRNKTRILIVNARLSKNSYGHYMRTRCLWKHLSPDTILATSQQDAKRYERLFERAQVSTMPNMKFESMDMGKPADDTHGCINKIFPPDLPLTILASIRKQEEKDMVRILNHIFNGFPNQIVAIFPRHMHRIRAWKKRLASQNLKFQLRSQIETCLKNPGIILWDTFGELTTAYGLAQVVFVGGSLKPLGGQNFIEPAVKGAVIVTGPFYEDFAWATDEIFKKRIVIQEKNWRAVAQTITTALKNPLNRSLRRHRVQEYLHSKKGGTLQACNEILKAFDL